MADEKVSRAIQEMVDRIVGRFAPEAVILFGSHAKGTADPDSDVDLLVVMRFEGSRRALANEIDRALLDRELPLDLIVVTPEELARDRDQVGTVIRPALRTGKILYGRAA